MIRNVETMNFTDIEKAINALGEKVKALYYCMSENTHILRLLYCLLLSQRLENHLLSVAQARKNELAVEDMDGGTFTISNGGVFGSLFGTPIINPPQSAILGMHGIFDRPVAIDGKVRIM